MIFLLTGLVAAIFVVTMIIYRKNILEPSIVFTFSFLILSVMASINYNNYDLNIGTNTFLVLLIGIIEFDCVCLLTKHIIQKKEKKKKNEEIETDAEAKKIETKKIFKITFLVLATLVNLLYIFFVVKAVDGSFNGFKEISNAISKFDNISKFSDKVVHLPFWISNARVLIIGAGYWFIYVTINNFIIEKKFKILDLLIIATTFLATFLTGSRTNSLFMIIAAFVFYISLSLKYKKFNKNIIKVAIIVASVFILLFIPIARLLGRNIEKNFFEYISVYCGAEVKNLDIFLNDEKFVKNNNIWGSQTFSNAVTTIGEKIGFDGYKPYKLDLPFQNVNGKALGNVYTTFYPYIYDFGYVGAMIIVAIMAIVSQLTYENTKKNKRVSKSLLLYGIMYACLFLSFFSNKFYENIFTIEIIKYLVAWYACDWLLIKRKNVVKKKKYLDDKRKMKVLCITPSLNNCGGIESYAMNYYLRMHEDVEMDFITHDMRDENYKNIIESYGNHVFLFPKIGLNFIKIKKQVEEFFKQHNDYDIVHCHMANAAFIYLKVAEKYGIEVRIIHSHQNKAADQLSHAIRNIPLIKMGLKYANVNFACSKLAGDYLFKKRKYYVINNAIDGKRFKFDPVKRKQIRKELGIEEDVFVIGNVGRLCPQKNQKFLVDVFSEVNKTTNAKLLIIGDGELQNDLEKYIESLKMQDKIMLIAPTNKVEDYYQAMDIFVLPSLYEGLGIVNIEAQACGLKTIVSERVPDTAKISELLTFVNLSDGEKKWAEEILKNKKYDRKVQKDMLANNGYDIEVESKKLIELYRSLIQKGDA